MGWKLNAAGATGKWFIKAAMVAGFGFYIAFIALPMYFPYNPYSTGDSSGAVVINSLYMRKSIIPTSSSTPTEIFYFTLITLANVIFFYYALRSFRKMFAL